MISDRYKGIQNLVLFSQCILVSLAFWGWFLLAFPERHEHVEADRYVVYNLFLLLGLLVGSKTYRTELGFRVPGLEETGRRCFRQLGATLFYLLIFLVAVKSVHISRLFLFSFIPVLYLVLFVTNRWLPLFWGQVAFRRGFVERALLVGPRRKALRVKQWLEQNKNLGLEIVGLLTDDAREAAHGDGRSPAAAGEGSPGSWSFDQGEDAERGIHGEPNAPLGRALAHQLHESAEYGAHGQTLPAGDLDTGRWEIGDGRSASSQLSSALYQQPAEVQPGAAPAPAPDAPASEPDLPVLGHLSDVESVLASGITKIVMAEFPRYDGSMRHFTELCDARGLRLLVVADLDKIFEHPVMVYEDQGMFFLGLREEPLEDPVNRFFKRCLDILVASFVVVFILPVAALLVWCMQRLQSPGPLLYRQARPGFHNRPFSIFKFRTLHVNNPDVNRLPTTDDPRVYPAGRLFRKLSIDELPQFLNVLLGDMSVVGPRPHLMADNDRFPRLYNKAYVRTFVKPGVTGLAQARGFRGLAETPEDIKLRMESDIEYLENWSFWLDCWLILRTGLQMIIPPKNAV